MTRTQLCAGVYQAKANVVVSDRQPLWLPEVCLSFLALVCADKEAQGGNSALRPFLQKEGLSRPIADLCCVSALPQFAKT